MKKLLIIILLAGIGFLAGNAATEKSKTVVIRTTIYCDHCLECNSCGGKLQKDFSFEKGVQLVKLDTKEMTITVKYNPKKTNADEIRKKISLIGYDADDVKADPLAVSKLDECCLKKMQE